MALVETNLHRDIKPSHIFLRHGQPSDAIVLDFGVARRLGARTALTLKGMLMGTPGYMAPEQLDGQTLVDSALDKHQERPLCVIALTRPELRERFPHVWAGKNLDEIHLSGLGRQVARTFVEQMLGTTVESTVAEKIVDLAGGNPFYLEELVLSVAEGNVHSLPETVLGTVEGRLAALSAEARCSLRAGSILGQTFTVGGISFLMDGAQPAQLVPLLEELCEKDTLRVHLESPQAKDRAFAFRHALVREGAYAMLTEGDRKLGHRGKCCRDSAEP